jgi:hypothetical protein
MQWITLLAEHSSVHVHKASLTFMSLVQSLLLA